MALIYVHDEVRKILKRLAKKEGLTVSEFLYKVFMGDITEFVLLKNRNFQKKYLRDKIEVEDIEDEEPEEIEDEEPEKIEIKKNKRKIKKKRKLAEKAKKTDEDEDELYI